VNKGQIASIIYHDLFDFSLTEIELKKWSVNPQKIKKLGRYSQPKKKRLRTIREKSSQKKLLIARQAVRWMQAIPTIQFVGITGSLAMMNAKDNADIDFLIITSRGTLWITRLMTYLLLKTARFSIRSSKSKDEKDKLCLNMWMDEEDLKIKQKNIYTAHEIAQIIPLVNKSNTYERFVGANPWVFDYWPNAISVKHQTTSVKRKARVLNTLAYKIQYLHMKNRITREQISLTRAFFHPFDWGERVLEELEKRGLKIA
jgi:hypothetical protein